MNSPSDAIAPTGGSGRRENDTCFAERRCHAHPTTGPAGVSTFRNVDGRVVAEMRGDTLVKRVRSSRHLLRYPPAWAVDADILAEAGRRGAVYVEVKDLDTGNVYRAALLDFDRFGFDVNRGHGRQVGLPLPRWSLLTLGPVLQYELGLEWGG